MKSWQIFKCAHEILPKGAIHNIYRRSTRLVQYWAANPRYAKSLPNPIDHTAALLDELSVFGYGHVARAAIDLMAQPLGGHFQPFAKEKSDKHSLDGEAVDVTVALSKLVETARGALSHGRVERCELTEILEKMRTVKIELDQLFDVLAEACEEE